MTDEAGLADLAGRLKGLKGPLFARVAIEPEEPPRVLPLRDGVALKERFRAAVGVDSLIFRRAPGRKRRFGRFWTGRNPAFITPRALLPRRPTRGRSPR